MKKSLKGISFLLAIHLLISSIGISVYKHFCQNELKSASLFIMSNPCADEGGEDACNKNNTLKDACCSDNEMVFKLEENLWKNGVYELNFDASVALNLFLYSFDEEMDEAVSVTLSNKAPPFIKKDLFKHYQRLTYYG